MPSRKRGMPGLERTELRISLLGGFRVAAGDVVVEEAAWRLRKARSLVKLLALVPEHGLHRERVIEALWPDRDPAAASNNLRQAVFVARRALDSCGDDGAARLALVHDVLTLTGAGVRVDVEEFEAAAAAAEQAPSVESYGRAIDLYGGELLPEDRFEDWAAGRRQALRDRYLTLLVDLANLHEVSGDTPAALGALQRALVEDPAYERAHREVMRIYAFTGQRQRALAQFHVLRESLRREFEDEPDAETRRLYQDILARRITPEAAPESEPLARHGQSIARSAGSLPVQLTSFVGRERELQDVVGLARRYRLVTLTGPGGCGKTRLALEAAAELIGDAPGGVWLVELAGLSDGLLVPNAVGSVLGVESRSTRPSEETVAAHVGDREMLIVLDNCEHLVAACARLVEGLLTACPRLRILATSREPMHIGGEVDWRVPSLSLPEAVRLFHERATATSSRFVLSDNNRETVAEVCRRVDGIPLAVELAAARVGVLSPAQIAERLGESLAVLATGRRTALTRQQTLTATLDWSHELLDDEERRLFRRLAAFAGSFDLDGVEAVCGGDLDTLGRLVDKSLVAVEEVDGAARYRLLDTVRQYALEQLKQAGERQVLEARHRSHYMGVAEELASVEDATATRRRLASEADELRAALRSGLRADPESSVRLAASLWRFWHDRGDRTEGARWLQAALRAAPEPSALRAQVSHGLSVLALRIGEHELALAAAREAVDYFRQHGDRRALAEELHHLATVTWVFSDYDGAERCCEESRTLAADAEDPATVASVIHTLGVVAASRGETGNARNLVSSSVELLRVLAADGPPLLLPVACGYGRIPVADGRPPRLFLEQTFVTARRVAPAGAVAYALCDLAALARDSGEAGASRELAEESLGLFRRRGDELGAAQALAQLGNLAAVQGEHGVAREVHEESLSVRESANDARGVGLSLLAMSVAAALAADPERARATAERALALFERTDDGPGRAAAVMQLGYLAEDAGRLGEARRLLERAHILWKAFAPNTGWCPPILIELADLDAAVGEPDQACERLRQAIAILEVIGDRTSLAHCAGLLDAVAAANAALTRR